MIQKCLKLTRCTASAHWWFGLQKNQNFNIFVGFVVSFGLAMSYMASPSNDY